MKIYLSNNHICSKLINVYRKIFLVFSIDSRLIPISSDTSSNSLLVHDNNNKLFSTIGDLNKSPASPAPSSSSSTIIDKQGNSEKSDKDDQPADVLKKTLANRVSKYSLLGPGQILPTEQISSGMMVQGKIEQMKSA